MLEKVSGFFIECFSKCSTGLELGQSMEFPHFGIKHHWIISVPNLSFINKNPHHILAF